MIRNQTIPIGRAKRVLANVLALVAMGLRLFHRSPPKPELERAIIILEPFGLGDVISYQPLIAALRAAAYHITFSGRHEWRGLHPDVDWLDTSVPWGRHLPREKYFLREYLAAPFRAYLGRLRQTARGRIGIDVRGDMRDVLLLHLAGCREVITLSHYVGSEARVQRGVGKIVQFDPSLRRWELTLRFAAVLDAIPPATQRPAFPHLKGSPAHSTNAVGYVCVAPWSGKCWEPAKWRALSATLRERGLEPATLCGPGQKEAAGREAGGDVRVVECANLAEWAAQLQGCRFLVTIDSGPMHLADALDIPVVALFGHGLLPTWAPTHPGSVIVTHQGDPDFKLCAPTEKNTAQGREFMQRITVAEVTTAVDRLLATWRPGL